MSVSLGRAVGYLDLDTSKFKQGFRSALDDLKVFKDETATTSDKLTGFSSAATGLGRTLTRSVTLPLIGVGTAAMSVTAKFDAGMSKVQSISGATGKEMDMLRDKAIQMGAKTKFSASESADAFSYMAMAGWDAEAMLNGIEGIMDLAAASGEDLALTSDIVTDSLTAFGLQAKDSAHFADVLAKASSKSNTNVAMMGETFKYVAPVAGSLGYNVEDTAVAIGLMANSGIKASTAGTALRSIFTRLVKPVGQAKTAVEELNIEMTNSDGTMKPLSQTMVELRAKFAGLTESEKAQYAAMIAGQEGMSGLLAIVNASEEDFNKLTNEMNNADGAAKEMAGTMMNNLSGSVEQAQGALETLGIRIGDVLTPALQKTTDKFTAFIEGLSKSSDGTIKFAVAVGVILASIAPLLLIMGQTSAAILNMMNLYKALSDAQIKNTIITGINKAAHMAVQGVMKAGTLIRYSGEVIKNTGHIVKNTGALLLNKGAHIASQAAMKISAFASYTGQIIKNTAVIVANTVAQGLNALATSRVGLAAQATAGKILAFASANKIAILATLGFAAPIIALIAYMHKTGDSAEEVAQKITDFADKLAGMITAFADQFPSMVESFTSAFTQVMQSISQELPEIITALVGSLTTVITEMIPVIADMIPVLVDTFVQGFSSLVGAITAVLPEIVTAVTDLIIQVVQALPMMIPLIVQAGVQLLMGLVEAVQQIIDPLVQALPLIIDAIVGAIPVLIPALIDAGITLFMALVEAIPQIIPPLIEAIPQIINAIVSVIPVLAPALMQAGVQLFMAIVRAIPQIVPAIIAAAPQIIYALINGIKALGGSIFSAGVGMLRQLWNGFKSWIGTIGSKIKSGVSGLPSKIKAGIKNLKSIGKNWLQTLWTGISSWVSSLGSKVKGAVRNLPSKVKAGIGNLRSIGANFIEGLWSGISGKITAVKNRISSAMSGIKDKIRAIFNIASPSRWMRDMIGKNLMLGMAKGIADNVSAVLNAVSSTSDKIKKSFINDYDPFDDFDPFDGLDPTGRNPKGVGTGGSVITGGDTINIYSPTALTPMETAKQIKKAKRDLALGF